MRVFEILKRHHSAEQLAKLGELTGVSLDALAAATEVKRPGFFGRLTGQRVEQAPAPKVPASHLALLAVNPYRVVFVPLDFPHPLRTTHKEEVWGTPQWVWVGSAPRLVAELTAMADKLKIPLSDGGLADDVADKINDFAALYEGDDCELAEDERTAWLLLYEGARLAVANDTALSLAG